MPLFTSVVRSSLWSLSGDTIKVFLTLCAEADPEGYVSASVDGIRRLADLPLADVERHIASLEGPDPYSKDLTRGSAGEGARIARVPNGWKVVNLGWYRELARKEADKAKKRKWWNENRSKNAGTENSVAPLDQTLDPPIPKPKPKPIRSEDPTDPRRAGLDADVKFVFEAWRQDTGKHRAKLDPKRRARIASRLKDFSKDELVTAIVNRRNDPFLMGQNDTGRVYDGLETLLRDVGQVERLRDLVTPQKPGYRQQPPKQPSSGYRSERTTRL